MKFPRLNRYYSAPGTFFLHGNVFCSGPIHTGNPVNGESTTNQDIQQWPHLRTFPAAGTGKNTCLCSVRSIATLFIFALIITTSCSNPGPSIEIVNLKSEYMHEHPGIDESSPRFTWEYGEPTQNFIQKAYQIGIATNREILENGSADVWVSDKTPGNFPRAEYTGNQLLTNDKRFYWKVTVWDTKGNVIESPISWFDMGKYRLRTDFRRIGHFECSEPMLNRLWESTNQWTTDTDTDLNRDLLNFDCIPLYENRLKEIVQSRDSVLDVSLFTIPYYLYNYYGEKRGIERLYPVMQKYLKHPGTAADVKSMTTDFASSLTHYLEYKLMSHFASILGNDASPYTEKTKQLRDAINHQYYNAGKGLYANAVPIAQALPLYLKIVPKGQEQLVADNLSKMVVANNYSPAPGPDDNRKVLSMLTRFGHDDVAYRMISKAESLPEASRNSAFMGEVNSWFYNALAGINYEKAKPGFEHIIIKPHFVGDIEWVKGAYNSVWGLIKSEWKRKGNRVELSVQIPAGTTATIYADKEYSVGSGIYTYSWKL